MWNYNTVWNRNHSDNLSSSNLNYEVRSSSDRNYWINLLTFTALIVHCCCCCPATTADRQPVWSLCTWWNWGWIASFFFYSGKLCNLSLCNQNPTSREVVPEYLNKAISCFAHYVSFHTLSCPCFLFPVPSHCQCNQRLTSTPKAPLFDYNPCFLSFFRHFFIRCVPVLHRRQQFASLLASLVLFVDSQKPKRGRWRRMAKVWRYRRSG